MKMKARHIVEREEKQGEFNNDEFGGIVLTSVRNLNGAETEQQQTVRGALEFSRRGDDAVNYLGTDIHPLHRCIRRFQFCDEGALGGCISARVGWPSPEVSQWSI